MAARHRISQGFSLLELIVVVVIVSVAAAIALERMLAVRVDAERAALTRTLGNLRSAVGMHIAKHIVRDEWEAIAALDGANPMTLMAQLPANYLGELEGADPAAVEHRRWYFDSGAGLLVYRVEFSDYFESALEGPARARFKLRLLYADKDGNGRFDRRSDDFEGADVVAAEPYRWLAKPSRAH